MAAEIATWFLPFGIGLPLLGCAVLAIGLTLLRLSARPEECGAIARPSAAARRAKAPAISVHLPISNEPSEVVAATLLALDRLDERAIEIIVLDNNTKDPALWRPIADLCEKLGERFRFHHIDDLRGYKAGALNLCLAMTDPEADFVLVVDADYQVDADILDHALAPFEEADLAFVQFPQAYRGVDRTTAPVASMFERYFEHFASSASAHGAMLPTGTLTLFRLAALRAVGGWPEGSLTEDAALGVRFWRAGYRGLYLPVVVGRGLMPFTLSALRKQRQRWAVGNAQVLASLLRRDMTARLLAAPGRSVLAQLTAWIDCRLLPSLVVIAGAPLMLAMPPSASARGLVDVAAVMVIGITALQLLEWSLTSRRLGHGWHDIFGAFRLHESLSFASMSALSDAFFRHRLGFVRTPKALTLSRLRLPDGADLWCLSSGAALAIHLIESTWLPAIAALILVMPYACGVEASARLRLYAQRTLSAAPARPLRSGGETARAEIASPTKECSL